MVSRHIILLMPHWLLVPLSLLPRLMPDGALRLWSSWLRLPRPRDEGQAIPSNVTRPRTASTHGTFLRVRRYEIPRERILRHVKETSKKNVAIPLRPSNQRVGESSSTRAVTTAKPRGTIHSCFCTTLHECVLRCSAHPGEPQWWEKSGGNNVF